VTVRVSGTLFSAMFIVIADFSTESITPLLQWSFCFCDKVPHYFVHSVGTAISEQQADYWYERDKCESKRSDSNSSV